MKKYQYNIILLSIKSNSQTVQYNFVPEPLAPLSLIGFPFESYALVAANQLESGAARVQNQNKTAAHTVPICIFIRFKSRAARSN